MVKASGHWQAPWWGPGHQMWALQWILLPFWVIFVFLSYSICSRQLSGNCFCASLKLYTLVLVLMPFYCVFCMHVEYCLHWVNTDGQNDCCSYFLQWQRIKKKKVHTLLSIRCAVETSAHVAVGIMPLEDNWKKSLLIRFIIKIDNWFLILSQSWWLHQANCLEEKNSVDIFMNRHGKINWTASLNLSMVPNVHSIMIPSRKSTYEV